MIENVMRYRVNLLFIFLNFSIILCDIQLFFLVYLYDIRHMFINSYVDIVNSLWEKLPY